MLEILKQEEELGIKFDTIVVATGSGGTYAGLHLANQVHKLGKRVIGMAVCDDTKYFTDIANEISNEALIYLDKSLQNSTLNINDIEINDKYVGIGYALSTPDELEFIKKIARLEGVVFDPVYTGKGMLGLCTELQDNGNLRDANNILFIHTGGLFGLFPICNEFSWK